MRQRKEPLIRVDPELIGTVPSADLSMVKINKAVRVSFSGGLLGLLFGSSRGKVDSVLNKQNADGWNFCETIPDNPNLAIWLLRLIFLVATFGLWTISTGYIFIFEKPR